MALVKSEITQLLDEWSEGDAEALSRLMPLVVDDLRRLARKFLEGEGVGHTLEPTALVNEVYLRLAGRRSVNWQSRAQFFSFLGQMMRRVLVDHARTRGAAKRGGHALKLTIDETIRLADHEDPDLIALDDALKDLTAMDPRQARIVELRYFAGLTIEEVAEVEGISPTTIKREWQTARLWLLRELQGRQGSGTD